MNAADIPKLQELLKALPAAEEKVKEAEHLVEATKGRHDTLNIVIVVGDSGRGPSIRLPVTFFDHQRGHQPAVVQGHKELHALLKKEAHDHLLACRSRVEGIQFQIRKLTKGSTP